MQSLRHSLESRTTNYGFESESFNISIESLLLEPRPATATPALPVTSPTRLTRMRTPQILKFNENGEFSGLLYYSPHTVAYQDELYPTALHLFEARKFVERIRLCDHIEEVTAVGAELAEFMRLDWNNVVLVIVRARFFVSRTFLADRLIGAGLGYLDGRGTRPQVPSA